MAAQPPFVAAPSYNTPLNLLDEFKFRKWLLANKVPFNPDAPVSDYDMRGYWEAAQRGQPMARGTEVNPNDNQMHFTDYYKTPFHQTFSQESQWGNANDPVWINDHQLAQDGRMIYDEKTRQSLMRYLGGQ